MKLALKTHSTNENWNGDCDFGIVDLTPELAQLAIRRIENLKALKTLDNSAFEIYFWCYSCDYVGWLDRIDELAGKQSPDDPILIDGLEVKEEEIQRTECDQMVVRDDEVSFMCYPKHSDVTITTLSIPVKLLQEAAAA